MTLTEEYALSCFEVLTKLSEKKEVYLVRHIESGRIYIRKTIERYNRAIYEKLSEVDMEHLPHIELLVEDEGKLILIEEYIHGETLAEIMNRENVLQENQAIQIIISVLKILDRLHRLHPPVIHRDIKPENIMVSSDGVVKLIDFNASRCVEKGASQDTLFMGTEGFAAPEQYGFGQSDARTDLYACGIVLNLMLTGCFPKERLAEGVYGRVIQKCVRLEPAMRYQTAAELLRELEMLRRRQSLTSVQAFLTEKKESKTGGMQGDENGKGDEGKKRPWMQWLPVGFRSGEIWKMAVALSGYLFMFMAVFYSKWKDKGGEVVSKKITITYRLYLMQLFLVYIFYMGNYGDVKRFFPHWKPGGKWHFVCNMLLDLLYLMGYTVLTLILLSLFLAN